MEIREALLRLDDFCKANGVSYVVTGTCALSILGVPSQARDIDIKVFDLEVTQEEKLAELQSLSGIPNEGYEGSECYTFTIGGVKVNVIVERNREFLSGAIEVKMPIPPNIKSGAHVIRVQPVISALKDKMRLKRLKDKEYMLNLINTLTSL